MDKELEVKEPDISEEINAMLDAIVDNQPPEKSDDNPPEELKEEDKKVEPEEPPVKESDEPPPESKKEEPPPDDRDQVIADLRAKLAEKETPKEPDKPKEPEPPKFSEHDFLTELDFDAVRDDPKEFNKLLNKVYQKAYADTETKFSQALPNVVREQVIMIQNLQRASEQFYKTNPDLEGFKKVVGTVFEEIVTADPNQTYDALMTKTAPEVRKRLGLPEPKITDKKSEEKKTDLKLVDKSEKPPQLPSKGSKAGKLTDDKPSDLQSELDEMNKVIGR